jgi:hypothetical protein
LTDIFEAQNVRVVTIHVGGEDGRGFLVLVMKSVVWIERDRPAEILA